MAPRGDRKSSKCGVASIYHFHWFLSELMMNYAVLESLDFIGFTETPFLKTAPTIDFYFFGGYILVCGISAPQIAEFQFFVSAVNRPKALPLPSVHRA